MDWAFGPQQFSFLNSRRHPQPIGLQSPAGSRTLRGVMQPLALLLFERLRPGSQLVNRLQDLGYRVTAVAGPAALVESCIREKPILLVADVREGDALACSALLQLSQNTETAHIPVIATVPAKSPATEEAVRHAGVKLVVHDTVILAHLEQFIDQALHLE